MTVERINVHAWPGRGETAKLGPERRTGQAERFAERSGLILVAAAERYGTPERWGLGVALSVVGATLKEIQLIIPDRAPAAMAAQWLLAAGQVIDTPTGPRAVKIVTRSEFCDPDIGLFWTAYTGGAWLITADEGRSLGLLADWWGPGRGRFKGGFSLGLPGCGRYEQWEDATGRPRSGYRSKLHRPPLRAKAIGGHGLMVEFARAGRGGRTLIGEPAGHWERGQPFLGRIVDIIGPAHTFDGTDTGDLGEHLAAFGMPALDVPAAVTIDPDGACQLFDVAHAIHALAMAIDEEASLWLSMPKEYRDGRSVVGLRGMVSPGSVAARLIRRSGITPPLAKFATPDDDALTHWQAAAHGGWTTADLRGQVLPAVDKDVRSAYPAAWSLLGCWRLLCAQHLREQDVTARLIALCEKSAAGDLGPLLDPSTYLQFGLTLCLVQPAGEPWPVERPGEPGQSPTFDVLPFISSAPMYFTWPDVVDTAQLSGRVPRILSATKLIPVGSEPVRPIPLRGGVVVRPGEDPITELVRLRPPSGGDERLRSEIRGVANPAAWGIFARLDQHRSGGSLIERPAAWTWPPIGATVPAVARMWLGAIERAVAETEGAVITRDTDGIAVVALPGGGTVELSDSRTVRALSWAEVDELFTRFDALDPFGDGEPFWSMERGEPDRPLHLVSLGKKRYIKALPGKRGFEVAGGTEHSLGGSVVDPPKMAGRDADRRHRWTFPVAAHALDRAIGPDPGWSAPWEGPRESPFPVLRRWSAASHATLSGLPTALGLHPFAPVVEGSVDKLYGDPGGPVSLDPGTEFGEWQRLTWFDPHGRSVGVCVGPPRPGTVSLRTLSEWARNWGDPMPIVTAAVVESDPRLVRLVGRSGALVDALLADPEARNEDFQVVYDEGDPAAFVSELVRRMGPRPFADQFRVLRQTAGEIARGRRPGVATVERVLGSLANGDHDPQRCPECDDLVWRPDAAYCTARCREKAKSRRYRSQVRPGVRPCAIPGCGELARRRSETCSERHRKSLSRHRLANSKGAGSVLPSCEASP